MEKTEAQAMVRQAYRIIQEIHRIEPKVDNGNTTLSDYKDVGISVNGMVMLSGIEDKKLRFNIAMDVLCLIKSRLVERAKNLLYSECYYETIVEEDNATGRLQDDI